MAFALTLSFVSTYLLGPNQSSIMFLVGALREGKITLDADAMLKKKANTKMRL